MNELLSWFSTRRNHPYGFDHVVRKVRNMIGKVELDPTFQRTLLAEFGEWEFDKKQSAFYATTNHNSPPQLPPTTSHH